MGTGDGKGSDKGSGKGDGHGSYSETGKGGSKGSRDGPYTTMPWTPVNRGDAALSTPRYI